MYTSEVKVCASVLKLGIDFVYSSNRLGTQSAISNAMNDNSQSFQDIVGMHDTECVQQVLRLVCLYYLPPCGNATHVSSPSSICQEECSVIQQTCSATWQAATLAYNSLAPFLNCNKTFEVLFPLPNCCTAAGIQLDKTTG